MYERIYRITKTLTDVNGIASYEYQVKEKCETI